MKVGIEIKRKREFVNFLATVIISALGFYYGIKLLLASDKGSFVVIGIILLVISVVFVFRTTVFLGRFGILGKMAKKDRLLIKCNGKILKVFSDPTGEVIFWWELFGKNIKSFLWESTINMSTEPITSNPKLRRLNYKIIFGIEQTKVGLSKYWKKFGINYISSDIVNEVRCFLFDFNEERSRELAKFFNPLRKEQQEEFLNLVKDFISPKIQELGLEIQTASFSLP